MLNVLNLRKAFATVVAVDGVSLEVQRGELFGLLGPNGAGKTTAIRIILNIIAPDSGTITFDGKPFTPAMWNIIGYLPEERGLYRKSKIINTILYFASLKGIAEREAKVLAFKWLDRFGLKESAHRKVEELSKGNQQKVQLIISILHKPQLLILDEPFSGLDPVNQILLKDILMELRQQNVAIVFSTHQMEQVEKMCDNICLINKGKPVLSGSLREVKKQYGTNSLRIEFEGDGEFLKKSALVKRADVYQNYAELELVDIHKSRELLSSIDDQLNIRKFEIVEPSLNSIFINVVGVPATLAESPEAAIVRAPAKRQPLDKRIKRELFSLAAGAVMFLFFSFYMLLFAKDPDWIVPGMFLLVTLFSTFRFMKAKKVVENERTKQEGGATA
ncbi:MAG: ATP-binding cassette domain-containing protein [Ignavibacteriales bacterium]|nr:ATP-binding cassette domain-containing protein [Ignavibacteriales bacterium]